MKTSEGFFFNAEWNLLLIAKNTNILDRRDHANGIESQNPIGHLSGDIITVVVIPCAA